MPIMQVHFPEGALDEHRKAALAQRLTNVLIAMEGGANTASGRGFASVLFSPVARGDWWVGGRVDNTFVAAPGRFLVHVSVPEGYMNAAHKTEVHAAVNAAIIDVAGGGDGDGSGNGSRDDRHVDGASVLVIIDEVPEGNWGAGGHTISLTQIADTVGLAKDGERFAWVRSYFDAKARQFAAAGYPGDISGLLPVDPDKGAVQP